MTTCGEALADLARRLAAAGVESPRLDARLLLAEALGLEPMRVFSHPERPLGPGAAARLQDLADRRLAREPMSHILGRREFWSLSFGVTAATLDPRPDTETLVEAVLAALPDRERPWRLLDFGTGTGCIPLALLHELPAATALAVDVSAAALRVAADNARALGLENRIRFHQGDWGQGLEGAFDVITSNPPYIPDDDIDGLEREVAAWEPRQALAGGADGLDCYRALAPHVARLLAPNGLAALEVGQGQAGAVAAIFAGAGLALERVAADLAGTERCLLLRPAAKDVRNIPFK
ncbi:release factor glutamine methyltransferase [mine drainage metagenome]|uniref:peptide chain release factor N(5)-glutamine methyltransferase n=1 Tax=mine drainage metagenome TaxID=410659 RepID=A0A1J5RX93_9ZZZZ